MLYFKLNERLDVVAIASEMPEELKAANGPWYRRGDGSYGPGGWVNRNDMDSFMFARAVAAGAIGFDRKAYMPIDRGATVSPRFDVVLAPVAGDEVSMEFNGDSYPVGKIVSVSASMKRVNVTGPRGDLAFFRLGETATWLHKGFALIPGVVSKFNPEF